MSTGNKKTRKPETFVDVIDLFKMKDLAEALGVKYVIVQKMRYRNSIDPKHWLNIVQLTKGLGRGKKVTLEEMHKLKSGREHHPGTRHGNHKIAA